MDFLLGRTAYLEKRSRCFELVARTLAEGEMHCIMTLILEVGVGCGRLRRLDLDHAT
jgi:hypothetical protein